MVRLLLTLLACDRDGDGAVRGDCSPDNPAIGVVTWYPDADRDGWGDRRGATSTCTPNAGMVTTPGDCDDANAAAWPGAAETCDGTDEDCDGVVDAGAVDALVWYADADADSYGDPGSPTFACAVPVGTVANAADCDDADPAVFPGAADAPYDGIDADCAGNADDDADADGAPVALDCDDADPARVPGADDLCGDGVDADCDEALDACAWLAPDAVVRRWGTDDRAVSGALAGPALSVDLDDDGARELVVLGSGGVLGFPANLLGAQAATDTTWAWALACTTDAAMGVLAAVDVDGDGWDELIVAYVGHKICGDVQAALVRLTPPEGTPLGYSADAVVLPYGPTFAPAGDHDGDGVADLAFGGTLAFGPITATGAARVADFLSDATVGALAGGQDVDGDGFPDLLLAGVGLLRGPIQDLPMTADAPLAAAFSTVALLPDGDGDGYGELVAGDPASDEDAGIVCLWQGDLVAALTTSAARLSFSGADVGEAFGAAIAGVGDVDGDGLADLGVVASSFDTDLADAGAAWIVGLTEGGARSADEAAFARVIGADGGTEGGAGVSAVSAGGDPDGDGRDAWWVTAGGGVGSIGAFALP